MIALMAAGLLLSMTLPGCGPDRIASPGDVPIAMKLDETPPADLLVCPAAAPAFPVDAVAKIPPEVRSALMSLAFAYSVVRDQVGRLINWHRPRSCPQRSNEEAG